MKKIIRFLTLAVLLAAPWGGYFNQVQAQATLVQIGDGTATTNQVPIGTYYNYSITEQMYTSSEIGMAGTIQSIGFYYMGIAAKDLPITVYMKNEDAADLSTGISLADADQVFSGNLSVTTTAGWVTITLDTPFEYDGSSNLLIGIIKDYLYYFSGQSWQGTSVSNMARYSQNDNSEYTTSTVPETASGTRPNIQISIVPGSGPVCEKPATLDVSSVTATGATLTWTAGSGTYNVEYKTAAAADWTSLLTNTTATSHTLTGLTSATDYQVRVQSICSGETSGWKTANFSTLFGIPLTENFGTSAPTGWIMKSGLLNEAAGTATLSNSSTWSFGTNNNVFDNHARCNIYSNYQKWLIMPAVLMEDNVQLTFDLALTKYSGSDSPTAGQQADDKFIVLASTDNMATWTVLRKWDNAGSAYVYDEITNAAAGQTVAIDLSAFDGQNVIIAFYGESTVSGGDNNLHIDNVSINYIPSCPKPTDLTLGAITASEAPLTWTAGGEETSWKVYLNGALVTTVNTNSYTFTGLTASTDYTFGVAAVCGVDDESTIATVAGHTACGAVASFPYTMGFETADAEKLACWTTVDADGDGNGWDISALTAHTGTYVATSASYDNNSGELFPDNWLISPAITLPNDRDMQLSWWEVGQDASWPDETYSVYISTTGNTTADFNTTELQPMFTATAAYVNHIINLAAYRGETIWIAYRHYDCSDLYQLNIDDISVEDAPSCAAPADIAVDSWTYNTVTVSWTDNNAGGSTYVILDDLDNEVVTITGLSSTGVTITGLTAETNYPLGSFKVKAVCSGSEESSPVNVPAFYTGYCQSAPGTGYPINSVVFGNGANTVNNTTTPAGAPYYGDYHNMVGTVYQGMTADIDITFGASALRTLIWVDWDNSLSFEPSELVYNAVSPAGNPSTVNASFPIDNAQTLGDYRMRIGASSSYFNSYQVPCYYGTNFDVVYHDYTLRVAAVPSCIPPADLAITPASVDAHGATLTWTSSASAWEVSYSEHAADSWSTPVAANTASYTFTGLTSETSYDVRVRANCGVDGYSDWVTLANAFTTDIACFAPTALAASNITNHTADVTWTGTSASYNVKYRTAAYVNGTEEAFASSSIPTGWTRYNTQLTDNVLNGTTSLTTYSYGWSFGASNGVFDSHAYMNIYGSNKYWLVTPATTLTANAGMNFDLALTAYSGTLASAQTTGTDDRFVVLISTDNMASWTILREWNNSGSTYVYNDIATAGEHVNIDLSAYAGQTVKIAFYGESTVSNADNNLHIDNVAIGTDVPAGSWNSTTSTSTTASLAGLLAERKYEVQVQSDCSASSDGFSTWSTTFFTTDIPCATPTALAAPASGVKARRVDLTWTSYAEDWQLDVYDQTRGESFGFFDVNIGDVVQEGNNMTYTLENLEPETEYIVRLRSNCEASYAGDGQSEWSALLNVTTLADCGRPENVTVSNVGAHVADVAWTGNGDEFTVWYRTAATVDGTVEEFATSSIPSGWENKSGLLSSVMGGTALGSTTQWAFGTSNSVFNSHARINIYGTSRYGWLIAPATTLPASAALSFDVALTAYNSAGAAATTGTDDRFVVLISTDNMASWTILREWNNSGSTYVYNNIATAGENVNIDLSAYATQNVRIAFYGESTVSNADNDLHIDNVAIGTPVAAGTWEKVDITTAPAQTSLEGLRDGTTYELKVTPACDESAESDIASFTTLALPTFNVTANNWYALSSPMHDAGQTYESVAKVKKLTTGTYDFLRYDEPSSTWESQKSGAGHTGFSTLELGRGYIYRRANDAVLEVDGEPNTGNVNVAITKDADGWNLIGNPFMVPIRLNSTYMAPSSTAVLTSGGYKLSTNGMWTAITSSTDIAVGQAVLVKATTAGTLTLRKSASKSAASGEENGQGFLFSLSNDVYSDVAYAMFADGEGLPKISHLNPEAPMLSIDGYAIAMLEQGVERFPLSVSGQGKYTLALKENSADATYLHLIDRATGRDIDLLATPEYTFTANGQADRFEVRLMPGMDENGNVNFVYIDGTRLIVDGEGELQVFDVMGRQLGSAQVAGTATLDRSALGIVSAGVYVMRLGGNSQKIVVK